jgi:tRNA(Ile)-lysidine synthase
MFLEDLAQTAVDKCKLTPDEKVLVGVSGGADSLALMHGLHTLGYPVVVAHLDHGLRGDSAEDAVFVQKLAVELQLPFISQRIDVGVAAEQDGQTIEEAARHVRYRFLFEVARQFGAQAVAVGHHADDQVETILMHFLRGSALPGLSGMDYWRVMPAWDEQIPLVRPLLGTWRDEIKEYIQIVGWQARVDVSNQDITYFRNRLRHELLPQLETYNPQIQRVLWRMGEVLRQDQEYFDLALEEAWKRAFMTQDEKVVQLNRLGFLQLPRALQSRVLRKAISLLRPDLRDVGFDVMTTGLAFAEEPSQSMMIDLIARLNLAVAGDKLIVKTWDAELPDWGKPLLSSENFSAQLTVEQPLPLHNGWQIEAHLLDTLPENALKQAVKTAPMEAWLDADQLMMPLIVRGRREGERWQPLGMDGHHQSFQDFFITQKVPEHLRDIWPLICSGEEVAWVVGMRPSEAFKITGKTQQVLRLKITQRDCD